MTAGFRRWRRRRQMRRLGFPTLAAYQSYRKDRREFMDGRIDEPEFLRRALEARTQ